MNARGNSGGGGNHQWAAEITALATAGVLEALRDDPLRAAADLHAGGCLLRTVPRGDHPAAVEVGEGRHLLWVGPGEPPAACGAELWRAGPEASPWRTASGGDAGTAGGWKRHQQTALTVRALTRRGQRGRQVRLLDGSGSWHVVLVKPERMRTGARATHAEAAASVEGTDKGDDFTDLDSAEERALLAEFDPEDDGMEFDPLEDDGMEGPPLASLAPFAGVVPHLSGASESPSNHRFNASVEVMGDLVVRGQHFLLCDERTKTELARLSEACPDLLARLMRLDVKKGKDINGHAQVAVVAQSFERQFADLTRRIRMPGAESLEGGAVVFSGSSLLALLTASLQEVVAVLEHHGLLRSSGAIHALAEPRMLLESAAAVRVAAALDVPDGLGPVMRDDDDDDETENDLLDDEADDGAEAVHALALRFARTLGEADDPAKLTNFVRVFSLLGPERGAAAAEAALRTPPPESPGARKTPGGRFYVQARSLPPSAPADVSPAPLEPHLYQLETVASIGLGNAVVPFPTGKGKTLVAVLLASRCLADKRGAVLFVVESRDLADQQCAVLRRDLPVSTRVGLARGGENLSINGANQGVQLGKSNWNRVLVASGSRKTRVDVLVVTAGFLINLLPNDQESDVSGDTAGVSLSPFGLVVFDEAHHATEGRHTFVRVAAAVRRHAPAAQVVGLTASPHNLDELRVALGGAKVVMPAAFLDHNEGVVARIKEEVFESTAEEVAVARGLVSLVNELEAAMLDAKPDLAFDVHGVGPFAEPEEFVEWDKRPPAFGTRHRRWAASLAAAATARGETELRDLAWTLAEVSRAGALAKDLGAWTAHQLVGVALAQAARRQSVSVGATRDASADMTARTVLDCVVPLLESPAPAAKLVRLEELLHARPPGALALVRVATRLGAQHLAERLASDGFAAEAMMGKGTAAGMSSVGDAKRRALLDRFRSGRGVDVLVSTAAMEEGIDVPKCALVVCFSVAGVLNRATSLIQNAGRLRAERGEFYVFCSPDEELKLWEVKNDTVATGLRVREAVERAKVG